MILVDHSEPQELISLLQQSVEVVVGSLNQQQMSDYYFVDVEGKAEQYSRKQAGELLSNIDEAESQLRDYYNNADRNYQIVEGVISTTPLATITEKQYYAVKYGKLGFRSLLYGPKARIPKDAVSIRGDFLSAGQPPLPNPSPNNCLYSYRMEPLTDCYGDTVGVLVGGRLHKIQPSMYFSWIYRLDRVGITTFFTLDYIQTARLLVAHYNNAQKPDEEHGTLQRITKPRIYLRSSDPFVKQLVYLSAASNLGIGETKAEAIKNYGYDSILDLAMASSQELCQVGGIGKTLAERLLKGLGREAD